MKRYISLFAVASTLVGCGNGESTTPLSQSAAVTPESASVTETTPAAPQVPYQELIESADSLSRERKFNEAVQILNQAIAQDPGKSEAFVKRAAICSEANLLSQAVVDMTNAIKLEPRNAKFLNSRGYFLLLSKQYDRAETDFSDAVGLDLEYAQPYNNRGLVWIAQGMFEQAIKDFENAIEAKPDYLDAHNNRGFALLQIEKAAESIECFNRVLELDDKYLNGWTNRARAHMALERPIDAIADYTAAIALQPENRQLYISRAEAHTANNDLTSAGKDLNYVVWMDTMNSLNEKVARNPNNAASWAERGRHLFKEKRLPEARRSFDNALALTPGQTQALIGRAELAMHENDYATVIIDCTAVLAKEFNYSVHSLRGDAYFEQGQFGEAIADYDAARRIDERAVDAYRKRAAQFRASGDEQLAQADEQFANGLQERLNADGLAMERPAPRDVVIEQTAYEAPAQLPAKPAPELE